MQKFDSLFKSKNIFFIAIVIFVLSSFTLYRNRDDIFKLFKNDNNNLSQTFDEPEESKANIEETKEEAPLLSTKTFLNYVNSLKFPEAPPVADQELRAAPKKYSVDYTADTSKVGRQISGEPAQRILNVAQRQVPKFDVPNLEVSKVYIHYLLNVNLLVYNFLQDEDYSKELRIVKSFVLPKDIQNILANLEVYNNNYLISKTSGTEIIFPTNHKWLEKFIKIERKPSDLIPKEQDKLFILEKLKYLIDFLYSEKFMQEFINKDV